MCELFLYVHLFTACEHEDVGWVGEAGGSATAVRGGSTAFGKGGSSFFGSGGRSGINNVVCSDFTGGSGATAGSPNDSSGASAGSGSGATAGSSNDSSGASAGSGGASGSSNAGAVGAAPNVGGTAAGSFDGAGAGGNGFGCPPTKPTAGEVCDWSLVSCFYGEAVDCSQPDQVYFVCCYGRWKEIQLCF